MATKPTRLRADTMSGASDLAFAAHWGGLDQIDATAIATRRLTASVPEASHPELSAEIDGFTQAIPEVRSEHGPWDVYVHLEESLRLLSVFFVSDTVVVVAAKTLAGLDSESTAPYMVGRWMRLD